jgi:aryl-alcohol dehydrogenase-like predicted oxidoreductase
MELRNLGSTGLSVSIVGLGCNNFAGRIDFEATQHVIHRALDLGVTLFDTADSYGNRGGSEEYLGKILGTRRKDIVLATKFGLPMDDNGRLRGASRRYVMSAIEASLKRLNTDWIDLYHLHRPDPLTPIEETLRALDDLLRQGKIRYVGCSNLPAWQVVEAQWASRMHDYVAFASVQDEYSLLNRGIERDMVPVLERYGLGLLPYYPLASGMLTGKYRRNEAIPEGSRLAYTPDWRERFMTDENWTRVEALERFCAERGRRLIELAFSWLAARPFISSIIAGATRPEQVEQNIAAASWRLTADEQAEIDRLAPV